MGKSWKTRLEDTTDYLDGLARQGTVSRQAVQQIKTRVTGGYNGWSEEEISKALHLGREGVFTKYATGQSQPQRHALRALMLTMLVHQSHPAPHYDLQSIKTIGDTSRWKSASEADIDREIARLLAAGSPPQAVGANAGRVHDPSQYGGIPLGVTPAQLGVAKGKLSAPVASVANPIGPVQIPQTGSFGAKQGAFEEASRTRRVLSGHGSWVWDDAIGDYPWTQLKKGQRIFFYVPHYVPLSNSVGQKIDNHQAVACHSVYDSDSAFRIPDYTLHHRGSLHLLGHSKHDQKFVTTKGDKRLSDYIASFDAGTDIHWAACRVVQGWIYSNTAGDWVWAMWDTDKWEYDVGSQSLTKTANPPPQFGPLP